MGRHESVRTAVLAGHLASLPLTSDQPLSINATTTGMERRERCLAFPNSHSLQFQSVLFSFAASTIAAQKSLTWGMCAAAFLSCQYLQTHHLPMTPTRKYWIALAVSAALGAVLLGSPTTSRFAIGGLIGGAVFAVATRPRYGG